MSERKKVQIKDAEIGMRIKAHRKAIGMSQQTLAAAAGVTFQQIQKYEKGINRIASSRLLQIVKALNCTLDYLFGVSDGVFATDSANENEIFAYLAQRDCVLLSGSFSKIKDSQLRRELLELIQIISKADVEHTA